MTDNRITYDTDEENYIDIHVDGNYVASVDTRSDSVKITTIDPNNPGDAAHTSRFKLPENDE